MTWRLKKKTGVAGHKRKSDVDLNTFAPEFGKKMPQHEALQGRCVCCCRVYGVDVCVAEGFKG